MPDGPVAEWLCRGLQSPVHRFDSGPGLQRDVHENLQNIAAACGGSRRPFRYRVSFRCNRASRFVLAGLRKPAPNRPHSAVHMRPVDVGMAEHHGEGLVTADPLNSRQVDTGL